jgi:hypothetical protein
MRRVERKTDRLDRFSTQPLVHGMTVLARALAGRIRKEGAASEDMMADAIGFLIFGLAWLGFGAFVVAKPQAVLRNTQWPWTPLPRWGTRLLGTVVLAGAAWWFYLFAERLHR